MSANRYLREEDLASKFADVVKAIHLDDETVTWIVTVLKASQKENWNFIATRSTISVGNSANSEAE